MAEPTDEEGLTPTHKASAVPVTAFQNCCCGKPECKEIKDLIDQNAPDDHVWKGNHILVQLTENPTVKLIALWASVVHHLNAPIGMKTYRVARHHWSQAVLSAQKRRSNLVTLEQAKAFDTTDGGHKRHQAPGNKVGNIFRRINRQIPQSDLDNGTHDKYVQAPVQGRNAAREVALGFTSARASRANGRRLLSFEDSLPIASVPDALVPDFPLANVPESPNEALLHAADDLPMAGVPDVPVPNLPLADNPESPNEASLHAADDASSPLVASPVGLPTLIPTLEECLGYQQNKFTHDKQDIEGFMEQVEVGKTLRFIAFQYSAREIILVNNGEDKNAPKLVACCFCNVEGSVFNEGESLGYAVVRIRRSHKPACAQCAEKRRLSLRRERRKRKSTNDPANANSRARKDYMSQETMLQNTRNISRELNLTKTELKRLLLKGKSPESTTTITTNDSETLYHVCEKALWEKAIADGEAYFPPTFEADGYFTHATAVPLRLLETANHFYTASVGDWICIELSNAAMKKVGIVTHFEEPKPVGDQPVEDTWSEWRCPHIFGGIPATAAGVVTKTYPMKRDEAGTFLAIEGLTDV
jgi:uncharacterized protein (DUF952 family)